jgi:5,6,7,8-tetrahydromethanopterin hydro-lyase
MSFLHVKLVNKSFVAAFHSGHSPTPSSDPASQKQAASPTGKQPACKPKLLKKRPAMYIGESFIGSGPNAAHVNIILGPRLGPVGNAWAGALSSPTKGHLPYMVVLQPGVPVKPMTAFINKADLRGETHENMTWGPAQAGLAKGVQESLLDGVIPAYAENDWCVIAAVWVNWTANDADSVFENNYQAAKGAIVAAMAQMPTLATCAAAAKAVSNPFYTPKAG